MNLAGYIWKFLAIVRLNVHYVPGLLKEAQILI